LANTRRFGRRDQSRPTARHRRSDLQVMPESNGLNQAGESSRPGDGLDDLVESDQRGVAMLMSLAAEEVPTDSATLDRSNRVANQPTSRIRSVPLALMVILIAQAALSLHLVWSNTAYTDEALYLWAGRLEWAHWLHGEALPPFPTYFSGAPVIYPPLGAVADFIGGLAGARVLSLIFMLCATVLLWSTTSRLYGRQVGFFASALWAFLGPTLMLGAYATFDAMSLFLLALAAWCATAHRARDEATGWMVTAALALALANATKYASVIFDPVVILLAVLTAWHYSGGKAALRRGALLTTCTFGILYVTVRFARTSYRTGISQTTLTRVSGSDSVKTVIEHAGLWVGAIVALACVGVVLSAVRRQDRNDTLLLAGLAGAALLAPLEQARIHTLTSLDKHADFGAWFAVIAAGYAIDKVITKLRPMPIHAAAMAVAGGIIAAVAFAGFAQAQALFASWPNSTKFVNALRPIVAKSHGSLLMEVSPLGEYYLPAGRQWTRWSDTYCIRLMPDAAEDYLPCHVGIAGNPTVYARLISRGFFTIIALNFGATPALDQDIETDITRTPGYHVFGWTSYGGTLYPIWAYKDAQ
jgi:hypothetical protein